MEGRSLKIKVRAGSLNIETSTRNTRELINMMGRRKVDILCVTSDENRAQLTDWKKPKTVYHGVD